jgi:uncharacterized membrane protein
MLLNNNKTKCMKKSFLVVWTFLYCMSCTKSSSPPTDNGPYFPKVKQIIRDHCITCHAPGGPGMPTNFTVEANIISLAGQIKAAVADPVSPTNRRMPPLVDPGSGLSEEEKSIIVKWYQKGGSVTD